MISVSKIFQKWGNDGDIAEIWRLKIDDNTYFQLKFKSRDYKNCCHRSERFECFNKCRIDLSIGFVINEKYKMTIAA